MDERPGRAANAMRPQRHHCDPDPSSREARRGSPGGPSSTLPAAPRPAADLWERSPGPRRGVPGLLPPGLAAVREPLVRSTADAPPQSRWSCRGRRSSSSRKVAREQGADVRAAGRRSPGDRLGPCASVEMPWPGSHGRPNGIRGGMRRVLRSRVFRVVAAVLVVCLLWTGWSIGRALSAAGTDSAASRVAEWARDHHLGWVVTDLEKIQYWWDPPKTGGIPAGGIPSVGASPAAGGGAHPAGAGREPHTRRPRPCVPRPMHRCRTRVCGRRSTSSEAFRRYGWPTSGRTTSTRPTLPGSFGWTPSSRWPGCTLEPRIRGGRGPSPR